MKTYEEMLAFTVAKCTTGTADLRYHKWCAYILLAEAYGKTLDEVAADISQGIAKYEKEQVAKRKEKRHAENEARRQANLAAQAAAVSEDER